MRNDKESPFFIEIMRNHCRSPHQVPSHLPRQLHPTLTAFRLSQPGAPRPLGNLFHCFTGLTDFNRGLLNGDGDILQQEYNYMKPPRLMSYS